MLRYLVKTTVELGLVLSGVAARARQKRRESILILAYHNIVPTGKPVVGDASLHLPQQEFARQLDGLRKTHTFVTLDDILADRTGTKQYSGSRPRVVITFDDAYRGALSAGIEELRARDLPATMFVAPAYLGGKSFWWDVITPPDAGGLDNSLRERALTIDAGKDANILKRLQDNSSAILEPMPPFAQCVTEDELRDALSYERLTLGSHTWSHPNLAQLNAEELAYELRASKQWLEERFTHRFVPAISYPYGRANQNVWDAAEMAGYTAGLMIDGGWVNLPLSSRYNIPRLNIPSGVSTDGFTLRASGIINS